MSKIILGTGSYDKIKTGNTVSITGDGGNAWGYFGPSYKKLAPKLVTYTPYSEKLIRLNELKSDLLHLKEYLEYRNKIEDEYIKSYYEIRLMNLDINELLEVLEEKFGNEIIFLCHEPIDEFCHRRLVADDIEIKTGIHIPEIITDENYNITEVKSIDYKPKILKLMREGN
ncbi:MAG: hypothetical protein RRY16_03220 [Bacilli bacterium]